MYPCSNVELIAAVSAAGGIGIVQPISLMYVYKTDLREGLKKIRQLTPNPYGFNVLTESSSKVYLERMRKWVDIALEEGCRFFITALGNPKWIVDRVKPLGGVVYHDVTERKWALKALGAGVDGFICVNNRAGGHAGTRDPRALFDELHDLGKPLICAGGIGDGPGFVDAMRIGYAGVQMGTRFIATRECGAHDDYKRAILAAEAKDIVLTEKLTGVPVAVIRTAFIDKIGIKAGPVARFLLRHRKLKHYMRLWYSLNSFRQLKKASLSGLSYKDYWQAGKSVDAIEAIEPAGEIARRLGEAWLAASH
jgi:nitronate monooxygenase